MAPFQNRAPRLDLSFPLEFRGGDTPVTGHCLNISESGLLGVFGEALDLWTSGELVLNFGDASCSLQARVARVAENETGFAFALRTDAERSAVREILAFAASKTHLVGRPPF